MISNTLNVHPLQTGSLIAFTGSYGSEPIKTDHIRKLSVQFAVSASLAAPFPVFTASVQISNFPLNMTGGEGFWITDPQHTQIFSGSAANLGSTFTTGSFDKSICAKNARLVITNQVTLASGTIDVRIFGRD